MTIKEKQEKIIADFSFLEDWEQIYEYIISLGKDLEPMPKEYKKDNFLIKGCQSKVWVYPKKENNKLYFFVDSDSVLVKGLASLISNIFSDNTSEEISKAEFYLFEKININEFLSPTRANGINAMLKSIKLYSIALKYKK